MLRTQVCVVGAGPAGLVVANVLRQAGVDVVVLEKNSREYVLQRARAGLIEHRIRDYLASQGLADGLIASGTPHGWCEFRCLGRVVRVNYEEFAGGATHWVYPQQLLVRDLLSALEREGGSPMFATEVTAIESLPTGSRVFAGDVSIDCDFVVGADGFHGVSRLAIPTSERQVTERRYPYDWLTILAEVDRPAYGVVYGVHPRGFAGMMPRTNTVSRFYLQVPAEASIAEWPASRIRKELRTRLAATDVAHPVLGDLLETRMLRMRTSTTRPFAHDGIFLAGDAAHVLTPSGAKGMNLAIADAADLAGSLIDWYLGLDRETLETYPSRREHELKAMTDFSDWLLRLVHLTAEESRRPNAALRSRLATLDRLAVPGGDATRFAHRYAGSGVDLPIEDATSRVETAYFD